MVVVHQKGILLSKIFTNYFNNNNEYKNKINRVQKGLNMYSYIHSL